MAATIVTSLLVLFPLSCANIVVACCLTGNNLFLAIPDRHRFCKGCRKSDSNTRITIRVT